MLLLLKIETRLTKTYRKFRNCQIWLLKWTRQQVKSDYIGNQIYNIEEDGLHSHLCWAMTLMCQFLCANPFSILRPATYLYSHILTKMRLCICTHQAGHMCCRCSYTLERKLVFHRWHQHSQFQCNHIRPGRLCRLLRWGNCILWMQASRTTDLVNATCLKESKLGTISKVH
jgi:hypothetical protein